MTNQTELRSNYLVLKNESDECKCPQSMNCTVDVNRISRVLDAYYVKFQNLSKDTNKLKTSNNDISIAFSMGATANHQSQIHTAHELNSATSTDDIVKSGYQEEKANETEIQQSHSNGIVDFVVVLEYHGQFIAKFFNFRRN